MMNTELVTGMADNQGRVIFQCRRHRCGFSLAIPAGRDAEGFLNRGGVVDIAAFYDGRDLVEVVNVLRGIAVDEDQVGEFARSDYTAIFVGAHDLSGG